MNEQTLLVFPRTFRSGLLLKPLLNRPPLLFHKQDDHLQAIHYAEPKLSVTSVRATYKNNNVLFRKRIGNGSSLHYKTMLRMGQERISSAFPHMQLFF